jgi:hypothetical protein
MLTKLILRICHSFPNVFIIIFFYINCNFSLCNFDSHDCVFIILVRFIESFLSNTFCIISFCSALINRWTVCPAEYA